MADGEEMHRSVVSTSGGVDVWEGSFSYVRTSALLHVYTLLPPMQTLLTPEQIVDVSYFVRSELH